MASPQAEGAAIADGLNNWIEGESPAPAAMAEATAAMGLEDGSAALQGEVLSEERTVGGLGEATEATVNPLHDTPALVEVRTATIYENQRYHKRRLTWGPVRSGLDPVPVFGSGPDGNHFIPWQWSSDPRADPAARVVPNVFLSPPWEWADKAWATDEHWEYASSWGCVCHPLPVPL